MYYGDISLLNARAYDLLAISKQLQFLLKLWENLFGTKRAFAKKNITYLTVDHVFCHKICMCNTISTALSIKKCYIWLSLLSNRCQEIITYLYSKHHSLTVRLAIQAKLIWKELQKSCLACPMGHQWHTLAYTMSIFIISFNGHMYCSWLNVDWKNVHCSITSFWLAIFDIEHHQQTLLSSNFMLGNARQVFSSYWIDRTDFPPLTKEGPFQL